jgi:hypothetical protein
MARDHLGDSPFLKRVLVPLWVVRLLVMAIDLVIYGLLFVFIAANKDRVDKIYEKYDVSISAGALMGILAVIFIVILVCFLLDIVAIIQRCRHSLKPKTFLVFNIIQSVIWIILCGLSFAGARSGAGIAINIIVLLSFLGMLGYSVMVFRRQRNTPHRSQPLSDFHHPPDQHSAYDPHTYNAPSSYPAPGYANAPEPKGEAHQYYGPNSTPSAHDTHELSDHHGHQGHYA